jgi:hypothetical protein
MKLINPQADGSGITIDAYARVTTTAGVPALTKNSSNISSITDRSLGRYTLNIDALASANASVVMTCWGNDRIMWQDTGTTAQTTTAIPIATSPTADDSFSVMITGA